VISSAARLGKNAILNVSGSKSKRRLMVVLLAVAAGAHAWLAAGQSYIPGVTYFGRSNYIEYAAGDLPFILSAPHGGTLTPAEIPDRTNCPSCSGWDFTTTTDSATDDVAAKVKAEVGNLTGHLPHIIICHLDRDKIDCNREVVEGAQGDPEAVIAWNEFQGFINSASNNVITNFGKGFYIDQHGQGHPEQRLELGYLLGKYDLTNTDTRLDSVSSFKNSSSIRTLANSVSNVTSFSKLLRGTNSFGTFMVNEGYPSTPSYTIPAPFTNPTASSNFFDGGYNTDVHGSDGGGPLSALQIEANMVGVRDSAANRTAYAKALARTLEKYLFIHYGINLRTCAPSVWDSGSGNWSTAANWALGILPVSTNFLVFAGAGGTATHNLAALATGNGVISSLTFGSPATGAYTLTGNAFTLIGGVTNDNAFTNVINNSVTLGAACPVAVNSGSLTIGGTISGMSSFTKAGDGTLALTAINTYSGPTTNLAGTISLNATSTFGSNGLLVLAGGNILSLNSRSTAPLSNAIVMTADTTILGNGTLTNSNRILPFSANSITTSGGTLTIRNAGTNPFATNNAFRVRFTGGGFDFTQPIVVGHVSDLPAAMSQLESYNDDLTGDQSFTGVISGTGQLRRDAASVSASGRTILSGANTYSGGTLVNAGTLLVNNSNGSGTGSGGVIVNSAGTLGGSGMIAGPVVCAGVISPGESAGTLTLDGGLDLSSGTNVWELSSLSDTGAGTNYDQLLLTGGNLALGGSSTLRIEFIGSAATPDNTSPFWMMSHAWKIIALSVTGTNFGATTFMTILNGDFSTGSFTNTTDASGNVWLSYIATPAAKPVVESFDLIEPGAFSLTCTAETNRSYVLETATNLSGGNWMALSTNVAPGSLLTLANISSEGPIRFYRVVAVP
jgi:autotransporter-associated beta strand protein